MWANWARTHACEPVALEHPASVAEVVEAVGRAGAANREVRVAGTGHSFNDAALSDGTLLALDRMGGVLDADPASGLVRVQAGITLRRLSRELLARGLALPNLGDIDVQALAGAVATGTHGTGSRLQNISASVAGIELVAGDGSVRRLGEPDGGELRAARVGLGSLGVVTELTLRCVPAFRLHGLDEPRPLAAVLERLDELVDGNDHFEFWTFPHSGTAITRTNNRTDAPRAPLGRASGWVSEVLLDNHAFYAVNRVARRFPRAIPWLNRFAGASASRRERVDWSFAIFASPRLVRFTEMEYAIPRERAAEAVLAVRAILERHPISFPIELRFVAGDDALLSPAYERDSAYLAVHAFEGMPCEPAFREVEGLLGGWGGRPHWGKRSFLEADALAGRYPRWDDFQRVRAQLDPQGRFENAWARRVLGPVSARARSHAA